MSHILRSVFSSVSRNLNNRRHVAVVGLSTICIVAGISAYWSRSVAALVFKNGPTPVTHSANSSSHYSIEAPVPTCTPQTGLIIDEFRLRGANGVNDEFIEFYNNTDQN